MIEEKITNKMEICFSCGIEHEDVEAKGNNNINRMNFKRETNYEKMVGR